MALVPEQYYYGIKKIIDPDFDAVWPPPSLQYGDCLRE